ncbi:unnamed protein product [Spirodela intermedia]|uniref:AB hydrolase-1 domain-containing protein n=1 Tax=Spirodela intermedia TaxID=51605 RepID=A0A7I8J516_SPIIN|nr:unnamed protein product [Spirodela intermedia]CAA6665327.1 unnamed protein product [Spirodela intermedia]
MAAALLRCTAACSPPHLRASKLPSRGHGRAMAVLEEARQLRLQYDLQKGQSRFFHRLPSGLGMEVIFQKGAGGGRKPPLVFVHGSFHAAWCWAEHWLPFFSGASYDCYAVSLLGQGESDLPMDAIAGSLQTHTSDLADFIRKELEIPPVLVGHSFGGLIVQSYISHAGAASSVSHASESVRKDSRAMLAGAVLLCSVPPSGNSGLVWRYLLSNPVAAFKVTLSLAAKAFANSLPLCKETFFSSTMDDGEVQRSKLNASLPVPSVPHGFVDVLVLGAGSDFILDAEGLKETGMFYGVEPVCLEGVAHDMMLDSSWEKGAEAILSWLKNLN